MSLTVSRGLSDAGRWVAMATTVGEHLEALNRAEVKHQDPPPAPAGAFEAARRFFGFVLEGIAFDENRERQVAERTSPAMAGISNLSIAVNVIQSEQGAVEPDDLAQVKARIELLLETVESIRKNEALSTPLDKRQALSAFLRELQRQGELERYARIAHQERPTHPRL